MVPRESVSGLIESLRRDEWGGHERASIGRILSGGVPGSSARPVLLTACGQFE